MKKYEIIDAHCHIYPEKIADKAVGATDNFYGVKSFGKGTVENLIKLSKKAGISHAIVQSVATTPKQVESINRFIAKEVAESNGFLTGLGTLHPDSCDLEDDISLIKELGLKGVKLHPDIQRFKLDDYRMLKIYELCEGRLPLLVHTGDNRYDYSNPNRIIPILEIYKDLTFIGAHFGGWSIWEEATEKLKGYPNFYVDCSSSLYAISAETAGKLIKEYGADRVLFGTDYPMWMPEDEIERFLKIDLNETERQDILYNNAARLFNIK